jgi:hypothetical protein
MSSRLDNRLRKLEGINNHETIYVVSDCPVGDDDLLSASIAGARVNRGRAYLIANEMTPDKWLASIGMGDINNA